LPNSFYNRKFVQFLNAKAVMIERDLKAKLEFLATKYPIITLTGPRQSGKSTLLRNTFPHYNYVSLENTEIRLLAETDPNGFLATYPDKTIIDEAQLVPKLFSYLQTHTDLRGKEGMYLLAGSQNFLLLQNITQSLAGRTAILKLLPFSRSELQAVNKNKQWIDEEIFTGSYPRIFDKDIAATDFYPYYIQTYIERDVRQLKHIGDINKFILFLKMCAGRVGQLLNLSSLANECGIAVSTAQSWLSVLEASYILYLLKPDHNNYSKRLVKTPKLYFYDTGVACSLLNIIQVEQIATHYLRGALFENLVINEFVKRSLNTSQEPQLSFWRDKTGNEVDLIELVDSKQHGYEIKSGATYSHDYFKGLRYWAKHSNTDTDDCTVIYTGDKSLKTSYGNVICW
jgi:predicted AAA+ superfamily ATPase